MTIIIVSRLIGIYNTEMITMLILIVYGLNLFWDTISHGNTRLFLDWLSPDVYTSGITCTWCIASPRPMV